MGKNSGKAPVRGNNASRGNQGIAKPSAAKSALAASIAAARKQKPVTASTSSAAGTAALNFHLQVLNDEGIESDESLVETLRDLVSEVVCNAPGGRIKLPELGGSVRALANKRCLQASLGVDVNKQVTSRFGGWEAFVQRHAPMEFVVLDGKLCKRVSLPVTAPEEFSIRSGSAAPVSFAPASSRDVNALTLDKVAL